MSRESGVGEHLEVCSGAGGGEENDIVVRDRHFLVPQHILAADELRVRLDFRSQF